MMGNISLIQRFSLGDGPGIRTTVFLKGCPLHCPWCHNPETIKGDKSLLFFSSLCTGCGKCVDACPNGVHSIKSGEHKLNRELCLKCGKCVDSCPVHALEINGKHLSSDDVLSVIMEDEEFYRESGGGVTISGGEPLLQWEFTTELAKKCHENGIDVLIDTSAQARREVFVELTKYAKKYYVDVKCNSDEDYKRVTGGSLWTVLDNIQFLCSIGMDVTFRIPIIPGHNDSIEYLSKIADIIRPTGVKKVDLLPFHSLCESKYRALGQDFGYGGVSSLSLEGIKPLLTAFDGFDARVTN